MKTRRTLYSELLSTWATTLHAKGLLNDVQKEDIENDLSIDDIHEAISKTNTVIADGISKIILSHMDVTQANDDNLDEEIPLTLIFHKATVDAHRKYCLKEFSYASTDGQLFVITSSLLEKALLVGLDESDWKVFERMLLTDVTTIDFIDSISSDLSSDQKMVYVLTNQTTPDVWNLYSYAYLCHINKNHVPMPSALTYPSTINLTYDEIPYKQNVSYGQYFEAYHVMNESKHVQDVLGRFLRMYQVLELFAFRQVLVCIEKENRRNNAYVRNVIKEACKKGNDERKQFTEGFIAVFPNINSVITSADIAPYGDFIENIYKIAKGDPHSNKKVAKIIYELRNSIVHNKESELHFSYGNFEEYIEGIGLMKMLLPKMEKAIIEIINTPSCPVSFSNDVMPLY